MFCCSVDCSGCLTVIHHCSQQHTLNPLNTLLQVVLGVLFNVSQEYSAAVQAFETAVSARPNDYSILNKVCDCGVCMFAVYMLLLILLCVMCLCVCVSMWCVTAGLCVHNMFYCVILTARSNSREQQQQ